MCTAGLSTAGSSHTVYVNALLGTESKLSLCTQGAQDGNDYCTSQAGAAGVESTISHHQPKGMATLIVAPFTVSCNKYQNSSHIGWLTYTIAVFRLQ